MSEAQTPGNNADIWIIFRLKNELFAIPSSRVREMVSIPAVTRVPNRAPFMRGVINLRGEILPLVDLRTFLGLESAVTESDTLIENLKKREQDHKNWIAELEGAVKEKRAFKLTTDPHQCAFGKWYYSFQTDNLLLRSHLRKFEQPHADIHELGITAMQLQKENRSDEALELIESARNTTLHWLVQLFEELRTEVARHDREIALIIKTPTGSAALAVDSVISVEQLPEESIEPLQSLFGREVEAYARRIAKRKNNQGLAILLEADAILDLTSSKKAQEAAKS